MAFRVSWQIPVSYLPTASPKTSQQNISLQIKPKLICAQFIRSTTTTISTRRGVQFFIKATEEKDLQSNNNNESESKSESESESTQQGTSNEPQLTNVDSLSELGSEIKKAMKEREQKEGKDGDFWGGVAEEIREIEWPPFGKVLGTTGVVLGVIAGSSVVLLTVNAILAELSDRVFVGKGVQDFFS